MKIFYSSIILIVLMCNKISQTIQPGMQLSQFNFKAASILPVTSWDGHKKFVLLGEEAQGVDQGTWDDFGGKRNQEETHPLITAARKAWEQSLELLMGSLKTLRDYIDLKANRTQNIVVSVNKAMVTYVTNFQPQDLEFLTKNFYSKLKGMAPLHLAKKSRLAWVEYEHFKNAIAHASRDHLGNLIAPIYVTANIVNPQNPGRRGQIRNQIVLRPVLVSKLQNYFKNAPYIEGKDKKIRFYETGYHLPSAPLSTTVTPPIFPSSPTVTSLNPFSNFKFTGASVLPITTWNGITKYVLLSQEADGRDKDTYDDFSGAKDPDETPLETASREAWEESVNLLTPSQLELKNHIDHSSGYTEAVIASMDKLTVTYITNFDPSSLEYLTRNFHQALKRTHVKNQKEKKNLAWVKYDTLKDVIAKAPRDPQTGQLIPPIKVSANIINPQNPTQQGELKNQQITLRLVFVSKLQEYFKDAIPVSTVDQKIKFFKRGYIPPLKQPIIPILPISVARDRLKNLTATLSSLSVTQS